MRSLVEILSPAPSSALTTLSRIKGELDIATGNTTYDVTLQAKINEASSDVQAALGFRVPKEDVRETFWHDAVSLPHPIPSGYGTPPQTTLFLSRKKVRAIASVVVDDTALDPSEWRLDPDAGLLDRLDTDGHPCLWRFCKSAIVTMTAGYILPDDANPENGRDLDYGIEGAVVALVSSYWAARGRDPTLKGENIPGVIQREWWVGAVGDPELLPSRVLSSLSQFRRPAVAVA